MSTPTQTQTQAHAPTHTNKEKHRWVCLFVVSNYINATSIVRFNVWLQKQFQEVYPTLFLSHSHGVVRTILHFHAINNVSCFVLSLHYSLIPVASLTDIELCLLLFAFFVIVLVFAVYFFPFQVCSALLFTCIQPTRNQFDWHASTFALCVIQMSDCNWFSGLRVQRHRQ